MFITVDGIDGAGKTSLANALRDWFITSQNREVFLTKEPTSRSPWAKKLRQAALTERLSVQDELEYFHRDRIWHLEHEIIPALTQGKVVICDRYIDSTLAYQATTPKDADHLFNTMSAEILIPDITFILLCDLSICLNRIRSRPQAITTFETRETLSVANDIFMSRKGAHYRFINSEFSLQSTFENAKSEILNLLKLKKEDSNSTEYRTAWPSSRIVIA